MRDPDSPVHTADEIQGRMTRAGFQITAVSFLPASIPHRWSRDWSVIEACG